MPFSYFLKDSFSIPSHKSNDFCFFSNFCNMRGSVHSAWVIKKGFLQLIVVHVCDYSNCRNVRNGSWCSLSWLCSISLRWRACPTFPPTFQVQPGCSVRKGDVVCLCSDCAQRQSSANKTKYAPLRDIQVYCHFGRWFTFDNHLHVSLVSKLVMSLFNEG